MVTALVYLSLFINIAAGNFILFGINEFYFGSNSYSYFEAEIECLKKNATLAIIDTKEISHFITNFILNEPGRNYSYWIGLRRVDKSNVNNGFRWLDGTPLTHAFLNWVNNEPNSPEHGCVILARNGNHSWRENNCSRRRRPLCQRKEYNRPTNNCTTTLITNNCTTTLITNSCTTTLITSVVVSVVLTVIVFVIITYVLHKKSKTKTAINETVDNFLYASGSVNSNANDVNSRDIAGKRVGNTDVKDNNTYEVVDQPRSNDVALKESIYYIATDPATHANNPSTITDVNYSILELPR